MHKEQRADPEDTRRRKKRKNKKENQPTNQLQRERELRKEGRESLVMSPQA